MTDFATRRRMMVDTQIRPSDVTKFPIIEAMLEVPREEFVPAGLREAAYVGDHLDLGNGRAILDARVFAKMLDALAITPDSVVLDIGAGTGYSSAVLARLAEAVIAVEADEALAAEAEATLAQVGADNVAVITGPLAEGAPKHGPYDVIILQGSVEQVPADLAAQLGDHGRIGVIFSEGRNGVVRVGLKVDEEIVWRDAFNATAPALPGFARPRAFAL